MNDFADTFQVALFSSLKRGFLPTLHKVGVTVLNDSVEVWTNYHRYLTNLGPSVVVPRRRATEQDVHDQLIQGGWYSQAAVQSAGVLEGGYWLQAGSANVLLGCRIHEDASYTLERTKDFDDKPSIRFIENFRKYAYKAD